MLVLSSPSGAGKTTLSRRLLAEDNEVKLSISATTRAPREGEVDGVDYYFVSHERFDAMIEADEFLEYATVFDNKYGTPKQPVMDALEAGRDVLFDIDWQGLIEIKENAVDKPVSIFILPPSISELEARLYKRGLDSAEVVKKRMSKAMGEISHYGEYDYVLVNEDVDRAYGEIEAILKAERLSQTRQKGLKQFVRGLEGEHVAMMERKD